MNVFVLVAVYTTVDTVNYDGVGRVLKISAQLSIDSLIWRTASGESGFVLAVPCQVVGKLELR